MAMFDAHKLLSLKLANLASQDRRWLLQQLPEASQAKIQEALQQVRRFKTRNPEQLFAALVKQQETSMAQAPKKVGSANASQTDTGPLAQHCQAVLAGEVAVTKRVQQELAQLRALNSQGDAESKPATQASISESSPQAVTEGVNKDTKES